MRVCLGTGDAGQLSVVADQSTFRIAVPMYPRRPQSGQGGGSPDMQPNGLRLYPILTHSVPRTPSSWRLLFWQNQPLSNSASAFFRSFDGCAWNGPAVAGEVAPVTVNDPLGPCRASWRRWAFRNQQDPQHDAFCVGLWRKQHPEGCLRVWSVCMLAQ
ncbi:hypothetical protein VTK26DRAFT_9279 [Humicola hyalothermophila]